MKKKIFLLIGGVLSTSIFIVYTYNKGKKLNQVGTMLRKYKEYFDLVIRWMTLKQNGICIADYFIKKDLTDIAIYGMGDLGKILYEELEPSTISITCGIDRNSMNEILGIRY